MVQSGIRYQTPRAKASWLIEVAVSVQQGSSVGDQLSNSYTAEAAKTMSK